MEKICFRCVARRNLENMEESALEVDRQLEKLTATDTVALRKLRHQNRQTQQSISSLRMLLQTLNGRCDCMPVGSCVITDKQEVSQ